MTLRVFLAVVLLLLTLGACQKEEISPASTQNAVAENASYVDSLTDSVPLGYLKSSFLEFEVVPKFGKPNSTYYYFKVYDPSGVIPLCVKLYNKATGTITYLPMSRNGNYWTLSTKISENGWYNYRYVYSGSYTPISSTPSYILCNTRNVFFYTGISSISWPFGADGSSWNNRTVYVNGTYQTWRGGEETKGTPYHYGYGWNEGTHVGPNEQYSDDWNRGIGSQDLGAIIHTPLDGYIETIGQYYVSGYGYSKYVSVIQEAPDGKLYRFYVSHLQTTATGLYAGKYVRAGIDQIGTLGKSGASSPHAHTNMRVNGLSVKFYFDAQ